MEEKSKQSPILAYRLPDDITKEQREALNTRIKDIAKARKMNYFELLSLWVENDYLIGEYDVKQNVKLDMTQEILDRLEKLEERLTNTPVPVPTKVYSGTMRHGFPENIKQIVEQPVEHSENVKQIVEHIINHSEKVKQNVEQFIEPTEDVKQNIKQNVYTREELVARAKELASQGLSSGDIVKVFTEEGISPPKGRGTGWSARTIRDWVKE